MTKAFTIPTLALAALAVTASSLPAAAAFQDQETVRSSYGNIVVDSRGNCIRTRWVGDGNECGVTELSRVDIPQARTEIKADERTVYFEFDKATLTAEARQKLDDLAYTLLQARDIERAEIVGYADRIGNTSYNMNLSKRRAQSVQNYLTQRGYLNTRVAEVRAVGESQSTTPCAANASRNEQIACLSPDRKVEVEVIYRDQAPVASHTTQFYAKQ